ncbi:protein FAR1-RELATED SEQUENCE 5-like [Gossypium australe]|uniref:Protein FAR1-RELATED SEQUENCE 5-like n=1 Tax=Gossypium australe TaxID=47621 RepID=A0A5B6X2K8_9ROSI|nr:protein FAR1-RELATED SEQUENCE 5-like [Gossypium australe]
MELLTLTIRSLLLIIEVVPSVNMSYLLSMSLVQFSGMPTGDPHLHLRLFMEVSGSFKLAGMTEDALRLKLFPYLLRDKA